MGFDEGHFAFDSPNLTYYAGQIVHGKLVFNQDKKKTFRGIYVKVKGYCDVHWTSRHTRKVNNRTEHYTKNHNSHESYFEHKVYLIGSSNGEVTIGPGHYEYPFQCQIPIHCPSSYDGDNGYVRYEVKAVVDRVMKFDQEKVATLTVIAPRDLNADPYCKEAMLFDFKESYCCWCMSAGTCEVVARVPQSGYCPGQTINIEVDCANRSNVEIGEINFELKEKIKFRATHEPDTRTTKNVIAKITKGPVPGNTTRNWMVELDIPQMQVYNLDACSYIDIDYKLEVTVSPSGCHSDTSASRRIVLGCVPLRESEANTTIPLADYPTDQPGENQPYPPGNQPFQPDNQYPPANQPYPPTNQPFPPANQPYPPANQPYPPTNQQYPPTNQPYPPANQPFPSPNQYLDQFPGSRPVPGGSPYPGGHQPYPAAPYQTPTPGFQPTGNENKDGASVPLLPPTAGLPYPSMPSPYMASAPEPSTPDQGENQPHEQNPDNLSANPITNSNVTPTTGSQTAGYEVNTPVAFSRSPMPSPYLLASAPEQTTPDFVGDTTSMHASPAYNPDVVTAPACIIQPASPYSNTTIEPASSASNSLLKLASPRIITGANTITSISNPTSPYKHNSVSIMLASPASSFAKIKSASPACDKIMPTHPDIFMSPPIDSDGNISPASITKIATPNSNAAILTNTASPATASVTPISPLTEVNINHISPIANPDIGVSPHFNTDITKPISPDVEQTASNNPITKPVSPIYNPHNAASSLHNHDVNIDHLTFNPSILVTSPIDSNANIKLASPHVNADNIAMSASPTNPDIAKP